MKKKLVIFIVTICIVLFSGMLYKQEAQTVECWWGVVYPSISFTAIEEKEEVPQVSSIQEDFVYTDDSNEIKYKFWFFEWLNSIIHF